LVLCDASSDVKGTHRTFNLVPAAHVTKKHTYGTNACAHAIVSPGRTLSAVAAVVAGATSRCDPISPTIISPELTPLSTLALSIVMAFAATPQPSAAVNDTTNFEPQA
jgi:hypothetical protein